MRDGMRDAHTGHGGAGNTFDLPGPEVQSGDLIPAIIFPEVHPVLILTDIIHVRCGVSTAAD